MPGVYQTRRNGRLRVWAYNRYMYVEELNREFHGNDYEGVVAFVLGIKDMARTASVVVTSNSTSNSTAAVIDSTASIVK